MDEQKVLFADLYQMVDTIQEKVKNLKKMIPCLLSSDLQWEHISVTANGVIDQSCLIGSASREMIRRTNEFLENGPYANESAGVTPLEGWANSAQEN